MIKINIDPNVFEVGGFAIAWHGVFTAVGILIGILTAAWVMRGFGESDDSIYNGAVWAVPIAIVGARLLYISANWDYFTRNPLQAFAITEGGISVWGAVLGGILGGLLYVWRSGTPLGKFADAAAIGLLLGMIIGRIGDIINGEHWGTASTLPWSFTYLHPETLGERGVSVHPAVVYEMLWNTAALLLLLRLLSRVYVRGVVFWLFLILYAIGRLWTHLFRKDEVLAYGLQEAQLISLGVLAVAVPSLLWVWRRGTSRRRRAGSEETTVGPGAVSGSGPAPAP
jgi:prolipoprotein diacylglyceryl transferase